MRDLCINIFQIKLNNYLLLRNVHMWTFWYPFNVILFCYNVKGKTTVLTTKKTKKAVATATVFAFSCHLPAVWGGKHQMQLTHLTSPTYNLCPLILTYLNLNDKMVLLLLTNIRAVLLKILKCQPADMLLINALCRSFLKSQALSWSSLAPITAGFSKQAWHRLVLEPLNHFWLLGTWRTICQDSFHC